MSIKTKYLSATDEYFHVYNRGVCRNEKFFSVRNYCYFLQRARLYLNANSIEIISYCLMPNHFHFILLQKHPETISDFIKSVCNGYVKAINNEQSRSDHLFEGKYKLKLIDTNEYLLHLSRYIHLNPVRAKLVQQAEDWEFSSCREYYGLREDKSISLQIIQSQTESGTNYRKFVEDYKEQNKDKIKKYLF